LQTVNFIPDSMKQLRQWVLWRLENGKKVPYSCRYNGRASTTNANTWGTYQEVMREYQKGGYSGIGFCLTKDDDFVFIDLDHVVKNGELNELSKNVIPKFDKSYVELSQSNTGLHIITVGEIPEAVKTAEIEFYSKGRYVAMTGRAINAVEPQEQQREIDILYSWVKSKRDKEKSLTVDKTNKPSIPPTHTTSPIQSSLSIDEIIARATSAKGGREFQALYNGDWQSLKIGDLTQSSADLSFANRLCFWCGGDTGLMIDVFRQSGMYRNERKMMLAIKQAVQTCGSTYRPKEKR
jgi:putative DNA primase/helicase